MSTSQTSGRFSFFLFLFAATFLGVGGYALYLGGTRYLNGASLTSPEVLPFLIAGSLFVLGPVFHVVRAMFTEESEPPTPPEEAPWRVRPAWQSNELTEEASIDWSTVFFAVFWNLVAWPGTAYILYTAFWQAANPEWVVLMILLFPVSGLALGWLALRQFLHRRKFGASTLVMETMPGRLGRRLQARLRTGVSPDDAPEEGFHVQLSCYWRHIRVTSDSDGGTRRKEEKDLKWRDEKHVRGRTYVEERRGTELPTSFELPTELPPSPPNKTEERILWELEVSADLDGLDYNVSFEIPVFEPDEGAPTASDVPRETAETADASGGPGEDVFWGLGDEEAGEASLQREQETEGAEDPYAKHEVGGDFTEPVSDGIQMEGRPGRGLSFWFAPARSKGQAVLLTLLGPPALVGGVYFFSESLLAGGLTVFFGVLLTYGAWKRWTHSSTVTVEKGQIEVTKGPFGWGTPTRLPCAELEDVRVETSGEGGNTTYYTLTLVRADPDGQATGAKASQALTWLQDSGLLGDSGLTEKLFESVPDVVEAHAQETRIANDLTNKQEADWIAENILEAAEREASFHGG